ncbi:hypothetical protein FQZ97_1177410 [compost metagenome]
MFRVPPNRVRASKAPAIDSGTLNRMISGSLKLSNCAASTRKIKARARAKISAIPAPDSLKSREVPVKSYWVSGGNSVRAALSR